MAHFSKEIEVDVADAFAWDALRTVGELHTRLVRGFVTDCRLDGEVRTVKFANGLEAREVIIDVCELSKRVSWTAAGGRLTHHNAVAQVTPIGSQRTRIVWTVDLLPHSMAPAIVGMVEAGLEAMKQTLEADYRGTA